MSTDAKDLRGLTGRLGSPRDVAATAAVAYRHGRFSGRHPVLMFVVLPPFALLLSWAAVLTVCLLVASALGLGSGGANVDGPFSQWLAGNMSAIAFTILIVPSAGATLLLCHLAARAGLSWKWIATACALVALVTGPAALKIALPTAAAKGALMFGFGVSAHPSLLQLTQFAVPLAIGAWAAWRQMKSRPTVSTA